MGGGCCLAGAALEIDDRKNLQRFVRLAAWQIDSLVGFLVLFEIGAQFKHLLGSVVTASGNHLDLRTLALTMQLPQMRLRDADQVGNLWKLEAPQGLPRVRRILLGAQHVERTRNLRSLAGNFMVEAVRIVLVHF